MKDTSVIEWYKDGKKIDPYDLHTPTVINPEYDDGTMSVAVDESTNGQPRYILHHNNSITIENVEDAMKELIFRLKQRPSFRFLNIETLIETICAQFDSCNLV